MGIKSIDIKMLYGRSKGRCNMCGLDLIKDNNHIGEMAHIIAKNSTGPRGEDLPQDNSYDNLILLCPNHHSIVDKAPHLYPVKYLKELKENFEKSINLQLNVSKEYLTDLSSLNILFKYIPINSFRAMAYELPDRVSNSFHASDTFRNFCIDNPHKYPFWDKKLNILWENFMNKLELINNWIDGTITTEDNILITFDDMINNLNLNRTGYNVYTPSDYTNHMDLNKNYLTLEQIAIVRKEVSILQQEFIYAHSELVTHIRQNYKEVEW